MLIKELFDKIQKNGFRRIGNTTSFSCPDGKIRSFGFRTKNEVFEFIDPRHLRTRIIETGELQVDETAKKFPGYNEVSEVSGFMDNKYSGQYDTLINSWLL